MSRDEFLSDEEKRQILCFSIRKIDDEFNFDDYSLEDALKKEIGLFKDEKEKRIIAQKEAKKKKEIIDQKKAEEFFDEYKEKFIEETLKSFLYSVREKRKEMEYSSYNFENIVVQKKFNYLIENEELNENQRKKLAEIIKSKLKEKIGESFSKNFTIDVRIYENNIHHGHEEGNSYAGRWVEDAPTEHRIEVDIHICFI